MGLLRALGAQDSAVLMVFALPIVGQSHRPAPAGPRGLPTIERAAPRMVRVSLTDRCDMACTYCRPSRNDGYLPADDRLDLDTWEALLRGLVREGVRRVRITGGEPLLYRDLVAFVGRASALGLDDLALTTNASRLAPLAAALRAAGLTRITISLDTLDPDRFAAITRGGDLGAVLAGIEAARSAGFDEIKTNTVVLRGDNDHDLPALTAWAWDRGITPRFIEVMGVGEGANVWRDKLVPMRVQRERLAHLLCDDDPERDPERGPARYVEARDGSGRRVGFISGSTDTYCGGCDRLRATSDGTLRPCLATNDGVALGPSLREAVRVGADPGALVAEGLAAAWEKKPDALWKGCTEVTARTVSMRATGG